MREKKMAEMCDIWFPYLDQVKIKAHNITGRPIVNVKDPKDVKKVEDCFILEFDPNNYTGYSSNYWPGKSKSSARKRVELDKGRVPKRVGSMVCVEKWEDVKKVEEVEDCFILEFDLDDEVCNVDEKFSKLCVNVKAEVFSDDDNVDVSILRAKGKVACRDFPHPRHLCGMHPFKETSHMVHCEMCYCYVCDQPAPCKKWTKGSKQDPSLKHCDATPKMSIWRRKRDRKKVCRQGS